MSLRQGITDSGLLPRPVHSMCSVDQMNTPKAGSKALGHVKLQSQAVWGGFPFRTQTEEGTVAAGWDRNCSVYVLTDDCPGALSFVTWSACREFMTRRVK